MNEIAVGCPVAHRAWIMNRWFDHIEAACTVAGVHPRYVFAVDLKDDCWPIIRERAEDVTVLPVTNTKGDDRRIWNQRRFQFMVDVRNLVLAAVRDMHPDAFLSVDSDVLVNINHIESMLAALDKFDAVGGKCYMTPTGTRYPSWARLGRQGQLLRLEAHGLFPVQVIMALKAMSPAAYAVDYEVDPQGEDIGWSRACARAGVTLGWDGQHVSKHVMKPYLLDLADSRVGY